MIVCKHLLSKDFCFSPFLRPIQQDGFHVGVKYPLFRLSGHGFRFPHRTQKYESSFRSSDPLLTGSVRPAILADVATKIG